MGRLQMHSNGNCQNRAVHSHGVNGSATVFGGELEMLKGREEGVRL